jgi:hypothetical protein
VQKDVIEFEIVLIDLNSCERCMVELVVALDRMIHYLTHLLEDTQHRFNNLQNSLEPYLRMDRVFLAMLSREVVGAGVTTHDLIRRNRRLQSHVVLNAVTILDPLPGLCKAMTLPMNS